MELLEAITLRKSTRSYKEEQIGDEALATVLNAGCAAPVGMGAYDSVHLTVIQNADLLDKITIAAAKAFNNPKAKPFYGAPTVIIVSSTENKKAASVEAANAGCIIENMSLAATDLGLGSVYLMGFLLAFSADNELLKELNLPEGFRPVSAIALGYPTEPLNNSKGTKHTISINTIK